MIMANVNPIKIVASDADPIEIVTYNILANYMCTTRFFQDSPFLNPEHRQPLLEQKIANLYRSRKMIYLQEVGRSD